jgi:hypothetical protein
MDGSVVVTQGLEQISASAQSLRAGATVRTDKICSVVKIDDSGRYDATPSVVASYLLGVTVFGAPPGTRR